MTASTIDIRRDATMAGRHAARHCLRDELFLLAHDEDYRWRPRVPPVSIGVGLAGAVLIDLLLSGDVRVDRGHVAASSRHVWQDLDPIAARVVTDLATTGAWIPLSDAVAGTAPRLYERTLIQLITTNVIIAKARRFGRVRYRPADGDDVVSARHYPRRRVQTLDRGTAHSDPATDALCALIQALRIKDTLYLELPADELRTRLDIITAQYSANQPHLTGVSDLITAVETVLGDVAVAVYR